MELKDYTIEEKAKRYDEAINRMKHYAVDEYGCSRIKVVDVFPELKESEGSEDERIKKAIKYGLDYVFTNNTTVYETTKELCLAWLEKQGEQKQVINYPDNLPKDNWELIHEFVNKFGRIPKDEDELNVLIEYVLKRQESALE